MQVLLIGESGVGKTHYGAQLLKRLQVSGGSLRLHGAPTNLEPFASALETLSEGKAAGHTPTSAYIDSVWPVIDEAGRRADLVWPDYGGEQVKAISIEHRAAAAWRSRSAEASDWVLMVRVQQTRLPDDVFSRPIEARPGTPGGSPHDGSSLAGMTDQGRLVELLQVLLHLRGVQGADLIASPRLMLLLTCWDELDTVVRPPEMLQARLPMLDSYVRATWAEPIVLGISALGRALNPREPDTEYATQGPESFGYVVLPDGTTSPDLALPVRILLQQQSGDAS
jgi:hypothetical protein